MTNQMDTDRYISVWLDRDSGPGNPVWIVSLDTEDDTETLRVYYEREFDLAVEFAMTEARRTGRRIVIDRVRVG